MHPTEKRKGGNDPKRASDGPTPEAGVTLPRAEGSVDHPAGEEHTEPRGENGPKKGPTRIEPLNPSEEQDGAPLSSLTVETRSSME